MSVDGRPLRVVLIDDDQFSREGLRQIFEQDGAEVAAEAGDPAAALTAIGEAAPDVVILDPKVAAGDPGESIAAIARAAPGARVAILTDSGEEQEVQAALSSGASSYLLKATPAQELLAAIRQTAAGSTVLSGDAARGLLASLPAPPRGPRAAQRSGAGLSAREAEVLRMMVAGADNTEIGRALSISRHTVKQHVTNIFDKLGVRTRVEAAVMAVRQDLL